MKIAYIINHTGITGVNNVVLDLVRLMQSHGHRCTVFYLETERTGLEYPCETARLTSWRQLIGFDIVHVHGLKPELFVMKNRRWFRKECQGTKLITTLHCYCFQDFIDLYGRVKGYVMCGLYLLTKRVFDKVVCLSEDMMRYYERWIPKEKLTYVYNTRILDKDVVSVTDEERRELIAFKGDGTLIGMNCVLLYRKGVDVMLKALTLLPDHYRLFIAGDGKEQERFLQMVKDLGVAHRVRFAGRRPDAFRYLPFYDIYAMPSRSEGFPLVLLEAACYGKKVVASRLPAVMECFTDDEVISFDMPDAQALADAIVKASQNDCLGDNLKKRFEQDYAPEVFYRRYMEVYKGNGE